MLDKAVEVLQLTVKPDRKTIGMTFKKIKKPSVRRLRD